jgi:hypothetical protein
MTTNKTYYIEARENGYAVVAENAEKASAHTWTQAQPLQKQNSQTRTRNHTSRASKTRGKVNRIGFGHDTVNECIA